MRFKSLLLCLPLAFASYAPVATAAEEFTIDTPLREIGPERFESGRIKTEIDGKTHEFATTIETLTIDPKNLSKDPETRKAQDEMNGTIVKTAQLRIVRGQIVVSLEGRGPEEAKDSGKGTDSKSVGSERDILEVSFTLDPKTLALQEGSRGLSYKAAGDDASERVQTKNYDLTIDSAKRLSSGALSMKGHFSGTLDTSINNKPLEGQLKPLSIKGTFDILNASGNEEVIAIIHGE